MVESEDDSDGYDEDDYESEDAADTHPVVGVEHVEQSEDEFDDDDDYEYTTYDTSAISSEDMLDKESESEFDDDDYGYGESESEDDEAAGYFAGVPAADNSDGSDDDDDYDSYTIAEPSEEPSSGVMAMNVPVEVKKPEIDDIVANRLKTTVDSFIDKATNGIKSKLKGV